MQRDPRVRQQVSLDVHALDYPFSFLHEYDMTPHPMVGESVEEKLVDFPQCVTHYYWIHQGANDEVPWLALFRFKTREDKTRYGFYRGECDYTGFDCQGSMRLYVSDTVDTLIQKAFTDMDFMWYESETTL